MSKRRDRDTDTLTRIDETPSQETRFDGTPDAPTIKQTVPSHGPVDPDAETHSLDPRVWAPLRVCPQCSLAWEVTGDWCPSCGTAFDKSQAPRATRVQPAVQAPRRREASAARPARRAAAHRQAPPAAQAPRKPGGTGKVFFTVGLFVIAIIAAFLVGQSTRPSNAQVDRQTAQAVQTARRSAANSYARAFEKMQVKAAAAIAAARRRGLAEGQANAEAQAQQAQQDSQSIFDKVTGCVLSGNC